MVREPVRASVEHEGWGATLLACQDEDGQWAGGAFVPAGLTAKLWEAEGQPWTATAFTFDLLRDLGLPPGCAAARRTVAAVGANARWDHAGEPFWDGEVVEQTVAGVDGGNAGLGLSSIRERATELGGWCTFTFDRTGGRVSAFLPVARPRRPTSALPSEETR